jgi:ribonuclease HI
MASWRELPPAQMAAHLLATPTIADGVWTSEPRLPREKRSDFVRRVLLGETPESQPETPEAEAAELADQKCYLLNTDGGNRGNPLGRAAIGALLRTRRLVTVAQISKEIGPATHNVAEYQALIEGLKLAREYGVQRIRVYMDSELVVDQLNGVSAVRQAHLSELYKEARGLVDQFKSFRISWVPRELNAEADRLVNDALCAPPDADAASGSTPP